MYRAQINCVILLPGTNLLQPKTTSQFSWLYFHVKKKQLFSSWLTGVAIQLQIYNLAACVWSRGCDVSGFISLAMIKPVKQVIIFMFLQYFLSDISSFVVNRQGADKWRRLRAKHLRHKWRQCRWSNNGSRNVRADDRATMEVANERNPGSANYCFLVWGSGRIDGTSGNLGPCYRTTDGGSNNFTCWPGVGGSRSWLQFQQLVDIAIVSRVLQAFSVSNERAVSTYQGCNGHVNVFIVYNIIDLSIYL